MEKNILEKIIETKRNELDHIKEKYKNIETRIDINKPSLFKQNFISSQRVKIIAEIKPGSPSEGEIFNPTSKKIQEIAKIYSQYPIGAISVLTDKTYFNGAYENIALVKEISNIPVLCKEFIIDPFQIKLAKYFGADAVLLIAEALPMKNLIQLYQSAREYNMAVLFECHSKENLQFLLDNNIDIIGINNRDLESMTVDTNKCITLKNMIPHDKIVVAESGFHTKEEIQLLEKNGFKGVLIGTSLLKTDGLEKKLNELVHYYE